MKTLFLLLSLLVFNLVLGQPYLNNYGSLFVKGGTAGFYSSLSIGYESPNVLVKSQKHSFLLYGGLGFWNANLVNKNNGLLTQIGGSYLYGENNHHLEASGGITVHFDKSLKKNTYRYIATYPNLFIGYRYQHLQKKWWLKVGGGLLEFFQVGIGTRL